MLLSDDIIILRVKSKINGSGNLFTNLGTQKKKKKAQSLSHSLSSVKIYWKWKLQFTTFRERGLLNK